MKISVIDLTNKETSDSATELVEKLKNNSFKWDNEKATYYSQKILKFMEEKPYDSIIDQINRLSQEDIIFLEGDLYDFSFIYPSSVYSNKHVKTIINKNLKINGIALPAIKGDNKDIEYMGQFYKPFIAKTPEEFEGLIYSLVCEKHDYVSYVPSKFYSSDIESSFKPLYQYPKEYSLFGYGSWVDRFTARNLNISNEEDAKAFKLVANTEPIQAFKNKLIETIYFNLTGKRVPYKDIPNPGKLYDEYITKKEDDLKPEYSIPEPELEIDFSQIGKKFNFGDNESKSLDRDIYFKSKELVKYVFKTDNPSFVKEVIRVTDIIIKKVLLSKEQFKTEDSEYNNAQFELLKYIYIVGSLHKIQHTLGIKVTDGKPSDYFLKVLFDKAKTHIDLSNLSKIKIEEAYWNGLIKIDQILNDSNIIVIQKQEKEFISSIDRYKMTAGLIRSSKPIKDEEYEPFEDELCKSIISKIMDPKPAITNTRRYKPSILSVNRSHETAFAKIYLNELKLNSDFESFQVDKFYEYYTNGCPKWTTHEWVNNKCKHCMVTQEMITNKDLKYYNLYKKDFEKHKPKLDLILLKTKPLPLTDDMPDIKPGYLKGKIDELLSKYKSDKVTLLNLTRNDGIPIATVKTQVIEGPIYKNNLHRMKFYLSYYGINVDILNNKKSNEDLFIAMFYKLVEKLDKEGLKALLVYDLKFAHQEIEKLLSKKAAVKTSDVLDPNLEYENEEKLDEDQDEAIDYEYDEDQDQAEI